MRLLSLPYIMQKPVAIVTGVTMLAVAGLIVSQQLGINFSSTSLKGDLEGDTAAEPVCTVQQGYYCGGKDGCCDPAARTGLGQSLTCRGRHPFDPLDVDPMSLLPITRCLGILTPPPTAGD